MNVIDLSSVNSYNDTLDVILSQSKNLESIRFDVVLNYDCKMAKDIIKMVKINKHNQQIFLIYSNNQFSAQNYVVFHHHFDG